MHGLSPTVHHDHGAALDAASHGQYHPIGDHPIGDHPIGDHGRPQANQLIHSLVDALSHRAQLAAAQAAQAAQNSEPSDRPSLPAMADVADLVDLKSRLCLREG